MATAANLNVGVSANTKQFQKGMRNAKRTLKRFGADIVKITTRVATFGVAMTTAAAAGAALLVRSNLKTIDSLAKTSDKLGITTEKLGALRYAAELTGVSAGTLDTALQRMVRRVSEAGNGLGEAKGALIELGLSATDLAQLSPDEQFHKIADAMKGVTNQGDRVRLAMRLFDTEGVSLVNTLGNGSEALRDIENKFVRLGGSLDREAAAKVEQANDAFTDLKLSLSGLAQTLTVELAPKIQGVSETLKNLLVENGPAIKQFMKEAFVAIGQGIANLLDLVNEMRGMWKEAQAAVAGFSATALEGIAAVAKEIQSKSQFFQGFIAGFSPSNAGLLTVNADGVDALAKGFRETSDKLKMEASELLNRGRSGETGKAFLDFLNNVEEASAKAAKATADARKEANELAKSTIKAPAGEAFMKKFADGFKQAQELIKKTEDRIKSFAERLKDRIKTPFERAKEEILAAKEALQFGAISSDEFKRFTSMIGQGNQPESNGPGSFGIIDPSRININALQSGKDNLAKQHVELSKQQLNELRRMADKMDDLSMGQMLA